MASPSPSSSRPPSRAHISRASSTANLRAGSIAKLPRDDDDTSSQCDTPSQSGTVVEGSAYGGLGGGGSVYGGTVVGGLGAGVGKVDLGNLNLVSWKLGVEAGSVVDDGEDEDEADVRGEARKKRRPFNAISTILSHPTKPPAPLRPSRKPLPPSSSSLPPGPVVVPKPPPNGYYQPYLDSISGPGGVWEEFLRVGRAAKGKERQVEEDDQANESAKKVELPDLDGIPKLFFDREFDLSNPLTWEEIVGRHTPPPNLLGSSPFTARPSISHSVAADTQIQDQLSLHLDHLESHLIHEISLRTPSFFSALSNLQSLTSQSTHCLTRIAALRSELGRLDEEVAVKGLRVGRRTGELRKRKMLRAAVGEVDGLRGLGRWGREAGESGDWVGGLEAMEGVGRWWLRFSKDGVESANGVSKEKEDEKPLKVEDSDRKLDVVQEEDEAPQHELGSASPRTGEQDTFPPPLGGDSPKSSSPLSAKPSLHAHLPLATLACLASVPSDLQTLSQQIATQLASSLASVFPSLLEQTSAVLPSEIEEEKAKREEQQRNDFRRLVSPLLAGLARCDSRMGVIDVWRNCVARSVKEGMRRYLQVDQEEGEDGINSPGEGKSQSLADTLREMSHEKFLMMSRQMYATMQSRIGIVRVLGEELGTLMQSSEFLTPSILVGIVPPVSTDAPTFNAASVTADLQDTLVSACELANNRAAKVLVTRTPQHADLTLEEFVAVFEQAWAFVVGCEIISGRMIVSLRGVISSQARAFLIKYHAVRLQASAKYVEEEQWAQTDVPVSTQRGVDILISSAVEDSAEHKLSTKALRNGQQIATSAEPETPNEVTTNGNGHAPGKGADGVPSKQLFIEGSSYHVVLATVKSVEMLSDYLKLMINLELVATDVMTRVVEYLKSFNSRTCQVVLGAGAMRSAGLKNITAKHLALASQSLSVVIVLIPYIREFVRRHLSQKQAVMLVEFDKLKRDYQEHQNEIHAKLVAIMADRLAVHCASLRAIDWEAKPAKTGPNAYAELLVKETTTLHKVLSKYLSQQTVHFVMFQVVSATESRLAEEYDKVEFKSDDAKKRMQQDVSFLVARLKDLTDPSSPSPATPLEDLVKNKPTPRRDLTKTINGLLRRQDSGPKPEEKKPEDGDKPPDEGEQKIESETAMESFGDVTTPDGLEKEGQGELSLVAQVDEILQSEKLEVPEEDKPVDPTPETRPAVEEPTLPAGKTEEPTSDQKVLQVAGREEKMPLTEEAVGETPLPPLPAMLEVELVEDGGSKEQVVEEETGKEAEVGTKAADDLPPTPNEK